MSLQDRIKEIEALEDTDFILRMIGTEGQVKEHLHRNPKLIGVEGNIGSGKSTLSRFLAARLSLGCYLEEVDKNELWSGTIEQFYKDPVLYGASVQMALLHMRRVQANKAQQHLGSAVIDRTFWADRYVFIPVLEDDGLPKSEVKFMEKQYEKFKNQFPPLDLLIILHCNPATALQRVETRGRGVEAGTVARDKLSEDHYLVKIENRYRALPDQLRESKMYSGPVLEIDQENFNIREAAHQLALLEELGGIFQIPRPTPKPELF
jgi:deoxyadenosine/deoxycytidine kinase